jgi:hypothetical protein
MTDGQLDGRTQRCEELSGKGKALSNGVQSDAIDAGPPRVARKRGVGGMSNPARCTCPRRQGCVGGRTIPRMRQRARESRADLGC